MSQAGKLEKIWIKRAHRGSMDPHDCATLVAQRGILNDANQGGRRQVTLVEQSQWEKVTSDFDSPVDPVSRRANLMVSGIDLTESAGKTLKIGACRVRIHGETKPCARMDEAVPGLRRALSNNWGGGAYGEVLDSGEIRVGDAVSWES